MPVSVSVSGNAGVSGGMPTAGVALSFTPSISDKQWQLYNFVSYNLVNKYTEVVMKKKILKSVLLAAVFILSS